MRAHRTARVHYGAHRASRSIDALPVANIAGELATAMAGAVDRSDPIDRQANATADRLAAAIMHRDAAAARLAAATSIRAEREAQDELTTWRGVVAGLQRETSPAAASVQCPHPRSDDLEPWSIGDLFGGRW